MFYVKQLSLGGLQFSDYKKDNDFMQVFEEKDFLVESILKIINDANELWEKLTKEYVKQNGDGGSCVLGAGIDVLYIKNKTPKLKGLTRKRIIKQPSCCQGSCNWEGERLESVQKFLRDNGIINTEYNSGWMD